MKANVGALKVAIFYQIMVFIILWINRRPLLDVFKAALVKPTTKSSTKQTILIGIAALVLAFGLKFLEIFVV